MYLLSFQIVGVTVYNGINSATEPNTGCFLFTFHFAIRGPESSLLSCSSASERESLKRSKPPPPHLSSFLHGRGRAIYQAVGAAYVSHEESFSPRQSIPVDQYEPGNAAPLRTAPEKRKIPGDISGARGFDGHGEQPFRSDQQKKALPRGRLDRYSKPPHEKTARGGLLSAGAKHSRRDATRRARRTAANMRSTPVGGVPSCRPSARCPSARAHARDAVGSGSDTRGDIRLGFRTINHGTRKSGKHKKNVTSNVWIHA